MSVRTKIRGNWVAWLVAASALWLALSCAESRAPGVVGIPEVPVTPRPASLGPLGLATPAPRVGSLRVTREPAGVLFPTVAPVGLANPALPDVVVVLGLPPTPAPEPTLAPEPLPDVAVDAGGAGSAAATAATEERCAVEQDRLRRWAPATPAVLLAEICDRAPIPDADYRLMQAFADCAARHRLLWEISDEAARYGSDPQAARPSLLLDLEPGNRRERVDFIRALCQPGPGPERRRVVSQWVSCMEEDPEAFREFKNFLTGGVTVDTAAAAALQAADPEQVSSAAYLAYDVLITVLMRDLEQCDR